MSAGPVKLAREAVSLDHLSNGRVALGVGLGDPADRGVRSDVPATGRRLPDLARERAAVQAAASGGATWWLEFTAPDGAANMLHALARGPVRV